MKGIQNRIDSLIESIEMGLMMEEVANFEIRELRCEIGFGDFSFTNKGIRLIWDLEYGHQQNRDINN